MTSVGLTQLVLVTMYMCVTITLTIMECVCVIVVSNTSIEYKYLLHQLLLVYLHVTSVCLISVFDK